MQSKDWELTKMAWLMAGIVFASALVLGFIAGQFFGEAVSWAVYLPLAFFALVIFIDSWFEFGWIIPTATKVRNRQN